MKKILLFICAATFLLAPCNTEKKNSLETKNKIVFTNTSLLKAANGTTDVAANDLETLVEVAERPSSNPKPEVRTITKIIRIKEKQAAPKVVQQVEPPVVVATQPTTPTENNTGTASNTGSTSGVDDGGTTATAPVAKKKNEGWSSVAKGATIGAVGDAVA
ncbi:MAG: hypothetical protein ACKVOM_14385 [Ferruginibacter sp.]